MISHKQFFETLLPCLRSLSALFLLQTGTGPEGKDLENNLHIIGLQSSFYVSTSSSKKKHLHF